ncbi:hypothetical protein CPB84DRAFT_984562 [Gymnopilus junonius]|uniref:Uncharacterized protein n=1 Tax=Gymnopilus junonius TaxID=109634 RepID=A0A9P5NQC9_GYMJU|nr:hypothetical protein CPB84DRAFT_984562 [Gymnopilus junonius]
MVPFEMGSVSEFLIGLDKQLRDIDILEKSPDTLMGIWVLIKSILAWLSKLDTPDTGSTPFSKHICSTYDRICRMIFHVKRSGFAQNGITIRQPFLEIEKCLTGSRSRYFHSLWRSTYRASNEEPTSDFTVLCDDTEEAFPPSSLSSDLFLLNFTDLKLDSYFSDVARSGNLYLSAEEVYASEFENLRVLLPELEDVHDSIREAKRKSLVIACIQNLQRTHSCSGWINENRPNGPRADRDERPTCGILEWCEAILKTFPQYYFYDRERQKVEDIIKNHQHSFAEE